MKKSGLIILSLMLVMASAYGQRELDSLTTPFKANIFLIGKSFGDSILLRWSPTTPGSWGYLNRTGYTVERNSFQNESDFDPAAYEKLTSVPLMPRPLEQWENIVMNGPDKELSAIAAQAIYGKSFTTSGNTIYQAADEFMNRFSFCILSADLSPVTADALGLRLVDRNVAPGRHYMYRVYPTIPSQKYQIDTAYFVLQNVEGEAVPTPVISDVYESEFRINFSWEKSIHEPVFSAYYVERSENGRSFQALTKIPFVNPESDNIESKTTAFQFADSVTENYKPYHYRLIGITPFGEKSPPSAVLIAMGRDRTPPPAPINVAATPIGQGIVEISWEMSSYPPDLDGFYIGRGDDLNKNFQPLHENKIPKDSTSYIDFHSDQLSGNYYVVAAVDTAGNGSISMVSYAAIVDSIPPSSPVGLVGEIDSTGVVTLKWNWGSEIDLAGYMVYFTNSADHVYSMVNQMPLADTIYTDTIQIKTLTRNVYYKIKAVDTRWNYSEYSGALELTRPDIIPPTSPVFSNYKVTEEGVQLEWIPSSSNDVAGYELEIYTNQELVRKIYIEKRDSLKRYTYSDTRVEPGNLYTYRAYTLDEAGLRSKSSDPVSIKAIDTKPKSAVTDLSASMNATDNSVFLKWSYSQTEPVKRFILYRAVEGATFVTYKSLPGSEHSFSDHTIRKGMTYEYTIKAVYNSGKQTPFGNIVSAKVE
jgi:fibronectin type 3 domain-containing protein